VTASFLSVLLGIASMCGTLNSNVNDQDFWRFSSVIYAEVLGSRRYNAGDASSYTMDEITLLPIATLSGSFDCAYVGEFTAGTWVNRMSSHIQKFPPKGAKVIVLLSHGIPDKELSKKRSFVIPNGGCACFPGVQLEGQNVGKLYPCLFEVTGFDDPKVTQTIENLRKLRAKHREEAEKAQAEKKPAGPAPPAGK
jgi:hypothetical protein